MKRAFNYGVKHLFAYFVAVLKTRHLFPRIKEGERLLKIRNKPLFSWMNYHQEFVCGKNSFLGIRALKNPLDVWVYLEIIYETKPDFIIEIGQKEGGSTLYLACYLDALGHGQIIAIDRDRTTYKAKHPRIIEVTGDCSDSKLIFQVNELCQNKRVMVIHDGDHSRSSVARDLHNYQHLLKKGDYMIVEDTHEGLPHYSWHSKFPYCGYLFSRRGNARYGVYDFLSQNQRFKIDPSREKWILTCCYDGFLKCIRDA